VLRAVVDTNVLVSALLFPTSNPGQVLAAAFECRFELIASERLLDEFEGVLRRPKIAVRVTGVSIEEFLEAVEGAAAIEDDPTDVRVHTRDPDDDYLISLADAHHADALVTGDFDLLEAIALPVSVVSPVDFLTLLDQS
jgi:uncharacterized protein